MIITDLADADIRSRIAAHAPERGGALYGPRGYPLVSHFEFDAEGATTAVSYVPSARLIGNVARVERETGLQFKGIVHSHPAGLTRPSAGDERTVASFFRLNPHISSMALPIVQTLRADGTGAFLHWYRAERASVPDVRIVAEEHHVIPVWAHLSGILERLRLKGLALAAQRTLQTLKIRNAELLGLVAASGAGHELMFFASIDYPVVPPVLLYRCQGQTAQLRFHWQGLADVEPALDEIAEGLAAAWRPASAASPSKPLEAHIN